MTPEDALDEGDWTRITVRHSSDPVYSDDRQGGWVRTADGLAMANQADVAHLVFPCNDHPSDKARFTFHITAPDGLTAVANGLPTRVDRTGTSTTWTYRSPHPMATELAQVSIGRSTVLHRAGPHGLPVRDVVPTEHRAALEPWLEKTPGQITWMEQKVGRYPFETYGLLMADATTGFELETQTLTLFERELFTEPAYPKWYVESIMVHELAHSWFGNSVSPATWADLWLNEGHATWYEALYAEETADKTVAARMKAAYGASDRWRTAGGPPAAPKPPKNGSKTGIFRANVYDAPRSCSTPCARRSAAPPSNASSARGSPATRTARRRPPTSSGSPPRPPAGTWAASSRPGCTARRPRRCPATRTGSRTPSRRPRGSSPPRRPGTHTGNKPVTRRPVPCDHLRDGAVRAPGISPVVRTLYTMSRPVRPRRPLPSYVRIQ